MRHVLLGDVCNIVGGGTPAKNRAEFYRGRIPWASIRDMQGDWIEETEFRITKEAVAASATNIIPAGNVVIATRVGLGKVSRVRHETAINQDIRAVIPYDEKAIERQYLFYWFKSIAEEIVAEGKGATVKGVTMPFVKSLRIPLPSMKEQQRIVSILDEAFAGIATAKANAEKSLVAAKALFANLRASAFDGEGWSEVVFEKCIDDVTYTRKVQRKQFLEKGKYPVVSQEEAFINGYWNDAGDVFRVDRPLILFGDHTKALKYIEFDFVLGADGVKILKPKPFLHSRFFYHQLRTAKLESLGYARHYRLLRELTIRYPFPDEQQRIASELDKSDEQEAELESVYTRKLAALHELKRSLLHQAFTGQL